MFKKPAGLAFFFATFCCLIPYNLQAEEKYILDVNAGVGLPRLIGFNAGIARLFPVTFGFGMGTIPIQGMAERYLHVNPSDYAQTLDGGYTIAPSLALSWQSFEAFVQYQVPGSALFMRAFYAVWYIHGWVAATASGGQLGKNQITLATAELTVNQPMIGVSTGWRWMLGSGGLYSELGLGLMRFLVPNYRFGVNTIVDPYVSFLPPEDAEQLDQGKQMLHDEIDKAMGQYRRTVSWAPALTLALGTYL